MTTLSRIILSIITLVILVCGVVALFLTQTDEDGATASRPQIAVYINLTKTGDRI